LDAGASPEQVWTLLWHAQQIPTYQLWHRRVLGLAQHSETDIVVAVAGVVVVAIRGTAMPLLRNASANGLLFQEPPRLAACPFLRI
jgi:hypothetical protein